jgi:hypothetical protein
MTPKSCDLESAVKSRRLQIRGESTSHLFVATRLCNRQPSIKYYPAPAQPPLGGQLWSNQILHVAINCCGQPTHAASLSALVWGQRVWPTAAPKVAMSNGASR